MINVIKNTKKVFLAIMWLFYMVYSRNSNERIIPMDISVYNGEGSILLNWTIPDSIKAKNTFIYSQKFGQYQLLERKYIHIGRKEDTIIGNMILIKIVNVHCEKK